MAIPSSRSLIFEVKSTGSELAFGRLRTSSGIFGNDRVVFKNPSTPRIKISRLYLRKSWQVYACLTSTDGNSILCTHIGQRTVARMFAKNLNPILIGHPLQRVCIKLKNQNNNLSTAILFLFLFLSCILRFALAPKYPPELPNNAC